MKRLKTPLTRSEVMASVHSKNTSFEILLRRELWRRGLRYRANDKTVFGKPDIVFKRKKLAVFVGSEFWHGKDYPYGRNIPKTNHEYWVRKIERNIVRDKEVNQTLTGAGWTVIRIWSKDLKKNLFEYVEHIYQTVQHQGYLK